MEEQQAPMGTPPETDAEKSFKSSPKSPMAISEYSLEESHCAEPSENPTSDLTTNHPPGEAEVQPQETDEDITENENDKDWSPDEEQDISDDAPSEDPSAKNKKRPQTSNGGLTRRRKKEVKRILGSDNTLVTEEEMMNFTERIFTDPELDNLCSVPNYNETIQQNNLLPSAPISKSRNKRKALAEAVAAVPATDKDAAKADRMTIDFASRKYRPVARHVDGGWKVNGLKTPLYPYQLEAGGWIIARENSGFQPRGGLLCHEMGLGKTLTMLSVTISEIPHLNHPGETTLIIVPSCLVNHWMHQIHLHRDMTVKAARYCAGSRTDRPDLLEWFSEQHIVVTSYHEISTSYPNIVHPKGTLTDEQSNQWLENYQTHCGAFHQFDWYRIILDEAQVIRNKDVKVSRAVRALKGERKWAVTGTPLLNRTSEIYPYLNLIGVPDCLDFRSFQKLYCNDSAKAKKRLKSLLGNVMHRRTHKSRIFGAPLLKLPNIVGRVERVKLSKAEAYLNYEIGHGIVRRVNGLAENQAEQNRCILAVITRYRMFVSHLLTAQSFLESVLGDEVMTILKNMRNEPGIDEASGMIIMALLSVVEGTPQQTSLPPGDQSKIQRPKPPVDKSIIEEVRSHLEHLSTEEKWFERYQIQCCQSCRCVPVKFFLASCRHRFCESCFEKLPDQHGNLDLRERQCPSCKLDIQSSIFCVDSLESALPPAQDMSTEVSPHKRKASPEKPGKQPKTKKRLEKSRHTKQTFGQFMATMRPSAQPQEDQNVLMEGSIQFEPEAEPELDWVTKIGDVTPGAKKTATETQIKKWLAEDEKVKIVVFTGFLATIRLLQYMCDQNEWGYAIMHGAIPIKSREAQVEKFRKNDNIKILLATLRTGGIGVDLTMANKCIIYDQWWNAAIEQQASDMALAYCRLHRIGQTREVEWVKLVAHNTIDDWILSLQTRKTEEINQYMNPKERLSREAAISFLSLFGEVTEQAGGGFMVKPKENPNEEPSPPHGNDE
ncbi:hypothetical protein N7541_011636 [Penicillium brevicompactum]|uniref:Uncharacterized protein n=1 Tax=Penicillium brevicompactum TaxID=5074 RepID=A0A9W9QQP5_PENBR|nr:hypothetical protein N7541_011636 [Penicillium brevicompactum]